MTRRNDASQSPPKQAQGRGWTAPRIRRLATSEAASTPSGSGQDAEGFS
jgi:hypothetical protein